MVAQMCGDSSFAPFPNSHCGAVGLSEEISDFSKWVMWHGHDSAHGHNQHLWHLWAHSVSTKKKSSQSVSRLLQQFKFDDQSFFLFFTFNPCVLRKPNNGRIHPSLADFSEAFGDFGFGRVFFLQQFCTFERWTNKKTYPSFWCFFHLLFQAGKCPKKTRILASNSPPPRCLRSCSGSTYLFFQGDFFSVDAGLVMARETRGLVPRAWNEGKLLRYRDLRFSAGWGDSNQMMVIVKESNPQEMPKIWRFRNHRPICPDTLSFSIVVTELFHGWCCRYLPKKVAEKALLIFEAWTVALSFSITGIPVTTILTGDLSCRNSGDLSHGLMILW